MKIPYELSRSGLLADNLQSWTLTCCICKLVADTVHRNWCYMVSVDWHVVTLHRPSLHVCKVQLDLSRRGEYCSYSCNSCYLFLVPYFHQRWVSARMNLFLTECIDERFLAWSWFPDFSSKDDILKLTSFAGVCSAYEGEFRIFTLFSGFWSMRSRDSSHRCEWQKNL